MEQIYEFLIFFGNMEQNLVHTANFGLFKRKSKIQRFVPQRYH